MCLCLNLKKKNTEMISKRMRNNPSTTRTIIAKVQIYFDITWLFVAEVCFLVFVDHILIVCKSIRYNPEHLLILGLLLSHPLNVNPRI